MGKFPEARILVVDDFDAWRTRVRDILRVRPEWKIISEARDGPEAVEEAAKLRPDLVLLDLHLPTLNGIESAKLIREKSPDTRIVFLTETNDDEIVTVALGVGRASVVRKTDAATDLLDAIATALSGL